MTIYLAVERPVALAENLNEYIKRPIPQKFIQLNHANLPVVREFMGDIITDKNIKESQQCNDDCGESPPYIALTIPTLEGDLNATHGDFITCGTNDDYYAIRADIFQKNYRELGTWEARAIAFIETISKWLRNVKS